VRRRSSYAGPETQVARVTRELQESLVREDATSEVLRVIRASPRDPKPVFETILENATRICEAKFGALFLCEDDGFRAVALHNAPPAFAQAMASICNPPPVLERLATSDKATLVIERQTDGKMRVTSGSWDGGKLIWRDQVVEVRNVDGSLQLTRKSRHHDEWDPSTTRIARARA